MRVDLLAVFGAGRMLNEQPMAQVSGLSHKAQDNRARGPEALLPLSESPAESTQLANGMFEKDARRVNHGDGPQDVSRLDSL